MEVWILLFTVWVINAHGDYIADESRIAFPTIEECSADGNKKMKVATEAGNPAIFFCFKKGEKIG